MYRTFTRTWWKDNPTWPNGLELEAGPKNYDAGDEYETEEEARSACKFYNTAFPPGRYILKMEYEEV